MVKAAISCLRLLRHKAPWKFGRLAARAVARTHTTSARTARTTSSSTKVNAWVWSVAVSKLDSVGSRRQDQAGLFEHFKWSASLPRRLRFNESFVFITIEFGG